MKNIQSLHIFFNEFAIRDLSSISIESQGVCTDFTYRPTVIQHAIAHDVEMIAEVAKATF